MKKERRTFSQEFKQASVVSHLGNKQDAQSRWLREIVARRGPNIASVALAHKNAREAWAILARESRMCD